MIGLYVISAGTVLIIATLAIVLLLSRAVHLLTRIAASLERIDGRDREALTREAVGRLRNDPRESKG